MMTIGRIQLASIVLCLIALPFVLAFDTSKYSDSKQITPSYKVYWKVMQETEEIAFGFEVDTLGWFGFGIGELTSGSMPGADAMVIQKNSNDGSIYIQDRNTYAYAEPRKDDCETSDWTLVSAEESNGMTYVEVTRPLKARDNQDRTIAPGENAVIAAWGNDDVKTISYHGGNRMASVICFFGCNTDDINVPNSVSIQVKMPSATIPTSETTYYCVSVPFETPNVRKKLFELTGFERSNIYQQDADAHIVRFEFIPDEASAKYVHHVVLHMCEDAASDGITPSKFATPANCIGADSPLNAVGCIQMYTWARGGRAMNLPKEAGFRIKSSSVSKYFFILDTHYNNPDGTSGVKDTSGVEMTVTSDLRQYDASTLTLGDPIIMLPDIPAGQSAYHVETTCPSECTSYLPHEIHIFSDYIHMHSIGKTAWSVIHSGDEVIPLNRIEYYAFANQHAIPVNITLKPGDRINTHCVWDSSGRSQSTDVNVASDDEMCMEFLSYYPAIPDAPYCGYARYNSYSATLCGANIIPITNPSIADGPEGVNRTFGTFDSEACSSFSTPSGSQSPSGSQGPNGAGPSGSNAPGSSISPRAVSSAPSVALAASMVGLVAAIALM